ncbi:MAG: DNA polymerase III subunit delta' [Dehalococcoidia bacterium]|nr:DNA polymerase III subunit tau [Chloroflexota bacterium]MBT9160378.1 DNA polymerase III subunit tau [Chloroflexota bacterium]MBT9162355.1 DNA polymerase III subunit tau [Chloroflexota bacterium]
MWQVIGQTKIVNSLRRSLADGRLSHAYLLAGPQHVGKMTLAITLAQALNCLSEDKPCGECPSCRRIASGKHSDVQVIGRAETETRRGSSVRKEISIDQIREMQHNVSLKPYEGDHRLIIIDGAEHMSEEAANSLLKTLEEPPPSTTIILLAADEGLLLPTIVSRCQRLRLSPQPVGTLTQALVERWGVSGERADLLARLCHGCIGWAIRAIHNEKALAKRSEHMDSLISLSRGDVSERFAVAAQLATQFGKDRASVRERLELWLTWWQDLLLVKNGCGEFITNMNRREALQQAAAQYSLSAISGMIRSIRETIQQLEQNANPRLALEVLMLDIPH